MSARTGTSVVAVTAAAWIAGCSLVAFPFDEYDKLAGVDASTGDQPPPSVEGGAQPDGGDAAASTCTDIQTDSHNCGACGHDCLGQPCANGLCSAETVYHDAAAHGHATAIALDPADPTYVFVAASSNDASNGYILRVAKTTTGGAAPETLATGIYASYGMVVAGGTVFWTQGDQVPSGSRGVGRVQKTPGGTGQLATAPGKPSDLAADATSLFWDDYDLSGLRSASQGAPASSQQILTSEVRDVVVDGTRLFVAIGDNAGSGSIAAAAKDGSGLQTIKSETYPNGLALDQDYVYWVSDQDAPDGAIRRAPKAGGPVTDIARTQNRPCCLTLAGTFAYWLTVSTSNQPAALMRAPVAGGAALALATVSDDADSTKADAAYVYWVDNGDVHRVAR